MTRKWKKSKVPSSIHSSSITRASDEESVVSAGWQKTMSRCSIFTKSSLKRQRVVLALGLKLILIAYLTNLIGPRSWHWSRSWQANHECKRSCWQFWSITWLLSSFTESSITRITKNWIKLTGIGWLLCKNSFEVLILRLQMLNHENSYRILSKKIKPDGDVELKYQA